MPPKSYPNIFWIVVDCVRSYVSGKDDRDKLDIMFKMSPECADFENMIVTAPSSVMSACTAMSGIPAYYLAGNYVDFKFDRKSFWCLKDLLETVGYTNHSVLNAKASREKLRDLVNPVDKKFWTKKLKHSQPGWPNIDVSRTFFHLLDSRPESPGFYLLWYNARRDPNISVIVEDLIDELKTRGMFDDSIFILTSDHGYPDLSRGLISDGWDLKKVGLPHDLVLTDDNIRVPFLLYYPDMQPCKVSQMASNEDIVPTLLDLLSLEPPFKKSLPFFGRSLLPLINGEASEFFARRRVRSDARFSMQSERITSLRSNAYKYIVQHEHGREELYNLAKDPGETKNLASKKNHTELIESFREDFRRGEHEAIEFQITRIKEKFQPYLSNAAGIFERVEYLLVLVFGSSFFHRAIVDTIIEKYQEMNLCLLMPDDSAPEEWRSRHNITILNYASGFQDNLIPKIVWDLRLEIVDDPVSKRFQDGFDLFKKLKTKKTIRVNGNIDVTSIRWRIFSDPKITYYRRVLSNLREKKDLFLLEPNYLFLELRRLMKLYLRST